MGFSIDDVAYLFSNNSTDFDYKRKEAFLRLEQLGVRTRIEAEVGMADLSGTQADDSGPMARLRLSRRLTPMLTAFAAYAREYPTSDVPTQGSGLGSAPTPTDSSILTSAPRLADIGEVGLGLNRPRARAQISFSRRKEES